jgi:hypothetical protein
MSTQDDNAWSSESLVVLSAAQTSGFPKEERYELPPVEILHV